ncbi:hypothetical protein [Winogradskyella vidalii]|uniref:hypothetical protein n=1 Tax=Winogradskyella vidalii TaxID=2615024 RepID=UPI0015CA5D5E|nr:hypothetical protein [Winogradskyella vidalii]
MSRVRMVYPTPVKRTKKERDALNETAEGRLILINEMVAKAEVELNNLLYTKESIEATLKAKKDSIKA